MVAQTEAGLTRVLLDELLAVQTASGTRHQADKLYESVVFAVGDVATLPGRLRGDGMPSPRAVQPAARLSLRRCSAGMAPDKLCYASQGGLLRGTRHVVTRHKAFFYATQGILLRGARHACACTRHDAVWYVAAAAVPNCYLCSPPSIGVYHSSTCGSTWVCCRSSRASLLPLFTPRAYVYITALLVALLVHAEFLQTGVTFSNSHSRLVRSLPI